PAGSRSLVALSNPLTITARTTTPSASTNARNGTLTARHIRPSVLRRRVRPCTASIAAPANATHAGAMPTSDVTPNPTSVSASTASGNTGGGMRLSVGSSFDRIDKSEAKNRRKTAYSTAIATNQGAVINAANRVNDSPALV